MARCSNFSASRKKNDLAQALSKQFGRGDKEVQLSLSQALVSLGELAIAPILKMA